MHMERFPDENANIPLFEATIEIKIGPKDGDKAMINVNFLTLFFSYFNNHDLGVIESFVSFVIIQKFLKACMEMKCGIFRILEIKHTLN